MAGSRGPRAKPAPKANSAASRNGKSKENTPNGTGPKPKLSRGSCTPCRADKLKCNKKKPSCDTCLEAGTECSYPLEQKRQPVGTAPVSEEPEVSPEPEMPAKPKKTAKPKETAKPKVSPKPKVSAEPKEESAEPEESDADTQTAKKEEDPSPTVRKSGRARKPLPIKLPTDSDDEDDKDELALSPTFQKSQEKALDEPRRNPKRKVAPETYEIPDELLIDETLAPMGPDELDQWEAWVELESDPAFFNVILQDLGVKDVKIQEIYSVDEGSLSILPKPVHGLIFLYQYVEEEPQEETEGGDEVWFANQITDNACATLALFNIIMNAKDIELGDRLKAFKEKSSGLIAPHKGHLLCNTTWIRSIHNQFSRRLDLLNADLALSNEVDKLAQQKKKEKKPSRLHLAKKQKKLKKPTSDAAYHFVAYVPIDNEVYQLDGLEKAPVSIGKVDRGDDWTAIARPFIESRMLQYQEESLQFNLLAACRSPLVNLREELATNIALWVSAATYLSMQKSKRSPPEDYDSDANKPEGFLTFEHPDIEQYGLVRNESNIDHIDRDKCLALHHWLRGQGPRSDAELEARIEELQTEQARIRAEYNTEEMMDAEGVSRAKGRKKDYTPVIHQWVQMLADKGVLGNIAKEVEEG